MTKPQDTRKKSQGCQGHDWDGSWTEEATQRSQA